ncbi:MAG: SLC13 family permease [Methanoculleaceae archaeon]
MKRILCIISGIFAFCLIYFLPLDPAAVPPSAQTVAAVTALMVVWWLTEAIPIPATALVPLVAFPLLGILTPSEAAAPYADKIIFLFLGGFIIAMSMQRWGLHRRIALNIIRMAGSSPRRLIFGFMVATAFLSMWISNTATAMMMVPIATAIIATILPDENVTLDEMTGEQRSFAECLIISIAHAATIGGIATIIGTPPNGIFIANMETLFPDAPLIDFFSWMKFGLPLTIVFLPIAWFWLTRGPYRGMLSRISHGQDVIEEELRALGPMSTGERWTLIVFCITAAAWIFAHTKVIAGVTVPGLDIIFPGIHDSTIAISGALLLFILPVDLKEGVFTMNWEWARRIPWGILLLFGGGISLSAAFLKSGLATVIVNDLAIFHALPVVLLVLILGIMISLITEVTSNTAMAALIMPVMAVTAISIGIHPYLLMLTAAITTSFAFMLPVATPPNAVAYGTGYITIRDMVRGGWVLNFLGVFLWTLFLFTLVTWVLGITPGLPEWAAASVPYMTGQA